MRALTHASILALIVLWTVAAHRGPSGFEPKRSPDKLELYAVGGDRAVWLPARFFWDALDHDPKNYCESGEPCQPYVATSIAECESRMDPYAIGKAGERGLLQVHPIHREAMRQIGLSFDSEADRIEWAVHLWRLDGETFRQWSCRWVVER